jgi:hypothetical protein
MRGIDRLRSDPHTALGGQMERIQDRARTGTAANSRVPSNYIAGEQTFVPAGITTTVYRAGSKNSDGPSANRLPQKGQI